MKRELASSLEKPKQGRRADKLDSYKEKILPGNTQFETALCSASPLFSTARLARPYSPLVGSAREELKVVLGRHGQNGMNKIYRYRDNKKYESYLSLVR